VHRFGDELRRLRVLQDVRDAVRGIVGTDRYVRAAGLEHGQHADEHALRTSDEQTDHHLRPDAAALAEIPGQSAHRRFELTVGQRAVVAADGHGVGGAVALTLEQRTDGVVRIGFDGNAGGRPERQCVGQVAHGLSPGRRAVRRSE
jgi:hypothetical protein